MEDHSCRSRQRPGLRWRAAWTGVALMVALPGSLVQAATFGHARMASADGEPLVIVVPVTGLTQADSESLAAQPAPEAAWTQAGLVPPVALKSLQVTVAASPAGGTSRTLRIHSPQVFSGPLADMLLDVRTATGSERYQVSLVTAGPAATASAQPGEPRARGAAGPAVGRAAGARAHAAARKISVKKGDTMFAIARRHAVQGVSIYQLMLALQRANPQAFIHQNINLVRAGATLAVPGLADMLSISDAEARRQFVAQTAAFYRLRHREAAQVPAVGEAGASGGSVSAETGVEAVPPAAAAGDQLRLSEGGADAASDERAAQGHALKDAESRVGQLEQNVQNLNQALQSQGPAAGAAAQDGAGVIAGSIRKIAGAISEASREAAAQADDRTRAEAAAQGIAPGGAAPEATAPGATAPAPATGAIAGAGPASAAAGAAQPGQTRQTGSSSAAGSASAGGATAGVAAAGASQATGADTSAGAPAAASPSAGVTASGAPGANAVASAAPPSATGAAATPAPAADTNGSAASVAQGPAGAAPAAAGQTATGVGQPASADGALTAGAPGSAPVTEAEAHANAEAAAHEASLQTRHRVSWLQDHLLGVMTGLLALIVFIIAWLLRRASAGRDESDEDPKVTAAMVREKLEGVDLELPPASPDPNEPKT